jgi:hypothetical protein
MANKSPTPGFLTRLLSRREVSELSFHDAYHLCIHFMDGSSLLLESTERGISVEVIKSGSDGPTKRQGDYLRFIDKYIRQYGRPPAEADMQRHFFVPAPSVNSMIQTLEKRGFISRQAGVARSIKLRIPT